MTGRIEATRRASLLVLPLALLSPSTSPSPQPGTSSIAACQDRLTSYSSPQAELERLELYRPAGGALLYLGVRHTNDPFDPQLATLEAEIERFRPTVAFYEGRPSGVGADRQSTVRRYGESGYLRYLARAKGLSTRSLEPTVEEEIAATKRAHPSDQVLLSYLLLRISLMRDREGLSGEQIRQTVAGLLREDALGITAIAQDLDRLDERFRELWPGQRWWDPPASWFSPYRSSSATGSLFVNDVIKTSFEVRDRYMFRQLVGAVRSGKRVIAVVGRSHLAQQAPALRCAIR